MNTKQKGGVSLPNISLPTLPSLPGLPELPELPNVGALSIDLDDVLNPPQPILDERNGDRYDPDSIEKNTAMDDEVIVDEFKAIREGRAKQSQAIELANDTEYWFAVYFQSREQKEAFLKAMAWFEHGDKYIDGRHAAKLQGIELPPRPAPYKVGKIDQKLKDLT